MLTLTIDASDLRRLAKDVGGLREKIALGIAEGLNAGGDKVRTRVQKALQKQSGLIRYNSVTSRVRTARAFPGQASGVGSSMNYQIIVQGHPPTKPLEFKTKVKLGKGGGVTVWFWGVPHKFPRSFQGTGKWDGKLAMRKGGPRHPTRTFDGPNLAKEAVKDQTAAAFFDGAFTLVMPQIEKQVAKAIGR